MGSKGGRPSNSHIFPVPHPESRLAPVEWIGNTYREDGRTGIQIWRCVCTCGGETDKTTRTQIEKGLTKSCGCIRREIGVEKMKKCREARAKKKLERKAALLSVNVDMVCEKETK